MTNRHDETVDSDRLPRWIADFLVILATVWFSFWIDVFTGAFTMTAFNFRTADFFGIPLLWTPGMAFSMVVFVGYFIGYRDILALEETNGA